MNQVTVQNHDAPVRTVFNLICNTASHILSALIAFVITPFLIARVGLEAYAFYPISAELSAFFGLFTGVVNATAARYVTVEDARGHTEEAQKYFSTVFFSNLFFLRKMPSAVLTSPLPESEPYAVPPLFSLLQVYQGQTPISVHIFLLFSPAIADHRKYFPLQPAHIPRNKKASAPAPSGAVCLCHFSVPSRNCPRAAVCRWHSLPFPA